MFGGLGGAISDTYMGVMTHRMARSILVLSLRAIERDLPASQRKGSP